MSEPCGARTKQGTPCRWLRDECRFHNDRARERARPVPQEAPKATVQPPAGRDLHELGWWLIESVLAGTLESHASAVIVSAMRVLSALGHGDVPASDDALAEVALRARLVHGLPPSDEAGWERAAELLDEQTLEALRRWEGETGDSSQSIVI